MNRSTITKVTIDAHKKLYKISGQRALRVLKGYLNGEHFSPHTHCLIKRQPVHRCTGDHARVVRKRCGHGEKAVAHSHGQLIKQQPAEVIPHRFVRGKIGG